MNIIGIIPARYQSTRFPGKPLTMIDGKSMIQRVYEQAIQATTLDAVLIATDDERIVNHVHDFSGNVVMTNAQHPNGTSRCEEALRLAEKKYDAVINIQGDEPFIEPVQIDLVAGCFQDKAIQIATLVKPSNDVNEFKNPSVVKVVLNKNSEALYFSRAPIPFTGDSKNSGFSFYKHIGIYGFRSEVLKKIVELPPSFLEQKESLEQLRWLENGFVITARKTDFETIAIDKPEDLERLNRQMKS